MGSYEVRGRGGCFLKFWCCTCTSIGYVTRTCLSWYTYYAILQSGTTLDKHQHKTCLENNTLYLHSTVTTRAQVLSLGKLDKLYLSEMQICSVPDFCVEIDVHRFWTHSVPRYSINQFGSWTITSHVVASSARGFEWFKFDSVSPLLNDQNWWKTFFDLLPEELNPVYSGTRGCMAVQ